MSLKSIDHDNLEIWVLQESMLGNGKNAKIARSRIEDAIRTSKEALDLSGLNLATLPRAMASLTTLKRLNINNNRLRRLPISIFLKLNALNQLDACNNFINKFPAGFFNLTNLVRLDVSYNCLSALSSEIERLQNLEELYLNNNHLEAIPAELANCDKLRFIHLQSNPYRVPLPLTLASLTKVQRMTIS